MNKQKNSEVKERLLSAALAAQVQADRFFPEVEVKEFPDPDFEVEFFHIRWNAEKKASARVVFAEYKKGELAIFDK